MIKLEERSVVVHLSDEGRRVLRQVGVGVPDTPGVLFDVEGTHERGIWVVTPKGVDHFRDYAVLSFTSSEGSFADHANSVATDRSGSVYLASRTLAQAI